MAECWYNVSLVMPVGDMVTEYRLAKYKGKQIDIMADINDTKPVRIAWLLAQAGCVVAANRLPTPGSRWVEVWEKSAEAKEAREIKLRLNPPKAPLEPLPEPEPEPDPETEPEPELEPELEPEPVPEEEPEADLPTIEELEAAKLASTIAGFWNTYLMFRPDFPLLHDMRRMLTGKDVQRMLELVDMAKDMLQEEDHAT